MVAALAGRTRAAVVAAGSAPLTVVPARPGDVSVLLDVGIEVSRIPGPPPALDVSLHRSDAEGVGAPVGSAFDRHCAAVGIFPDVWMIWAAAVLALNASAARVGCAVAYVVAASLAAVAMAVPVAAVGFAEAKSVGVLDAIASPRLQLGLLQRLLAQVVHPLAGDAELLAAGVKSAPLEREPAVHVLEHVFREAAQRAVVFPAVPETLREPVIVRGAVGPVRSILVPGT
jgi:hypothetical protein